MTKIYSDVTKQFYETMEEAEKAETEFAEAKKKAEEEKEKALAERKMKAEEIAEARKKMVEAQNNYEKLMREFINVYGSYHYSTSNMEEIPRLFTDFFFNF